MNFDNVRLTATTAQTSQTTALKASTDTLPCGHALMQEAPDAVLNALTDFIAKEPA